MISPQSNYYSQESDRLEFRAFLDEDINAFLPFFDRDDYQKYLAQDIRIPALERCTQWINRQLQRQNEHQFGQLAIIEKSTGKFIGVGGIIARENINNREEYEITYSLIPEFWGKGYARELALHFIDFAKENLPIKSVISLIHPENNASIRVAKSNGLTLDGEWEFMGMPVLIYRLNFQQRAPQLFNSNKSNTSIIFPTDNKSLIPTFLYSKPSIMKYLLIVLILFIGTGAFASDQLSNSLNQTDTSIAISHFDLGKNKKSRKGKRANKKRKRRCHRAARRNFAG